MDTTASGIARIHVYSLLFLFSRCVTREREPKTRRAWTRLIETELELSDHRAAAAYYYLAPRFLSLSLSSFPSPPSPSFSSSLCRYFSFFLSVSFSLPLSLASLYVRQMSNARDSEMRQKVQPPSHFSPRGAATAPHHTTESRRERGTLW